MKNCGEYRYQQEFDGWGAFRLLWLIVYYAFRENDVGTILLMCTCVPPTAPVCGSSRYGLALLSCYGFFVAYALRVNLSVAMVDMLNTNVTGNASPSHCPRHASPARPRHNHTVSSTSWFFFFFFQLEKKKSVGPREVGITHVLLAFYWISFGVARSFVPILSL